MLVKNNTQKVIALTALIYYICICKIFCYIDTYKYTEIY